MTKTMKFKFDQRDIELIVKEHMKRIIHDENFTSKIDSMKIEATKIECGFEISFIEENVPGITRYHK